MPLFDLVRLLGTTFFGAGAPAWQWWPLGMLLHACVGAIWAIFYAYFFWSTYGWKPRTQGLVFSLLPAALAGLVMVPQMGWMHPSILDGTLAHSGLFGWRLGWGGPVGVVCGHFVYGCVLGSLYTRPVGYRTGGDRRPNAPTFAAPSGMQPSWAADHPCEFPAHFMFATGIECSYPTIDNGRWRIDQLEETGHYRHWRRNLDLVQELGLRYLRYGPPLHHVWLGPGNYDWSFTDDVVEAMRQLRIVPIMDLCHFGLPDWLGNSFQNPEFPGRFARVRGGIRPAVPVGEALHAGQ